MRTYSRPDEKPPAYAPCAAATTTPSLPKGSCGTCLLLYAFDITTTTKTRSRTPLSTSHRISRSFRLQPSPRPQELRRQRVPQVLPQPSPCRRPSPFDPCTKPVGLSSCRRIFVYGTPRKILRIPVYYKLRKFRIHDIVMINYR